MRITSQAFSNMREIIFTHQFKKDLKLARRRKLQEDKLNEVIFNLANDIPLPTERKDHNLTGKLAGFRECHIQPDWLLIYLIEDQTLTLTLTRTGSHADLF